MKVLDPQKIADIFKSDSYAKHFQKPHGYLNVDNELLKLCADACYEVEQAFPWNDYNRQAYQRKFEDGGHGPCERRSVAVRIPGRAETPGRAAQ